MTRPVLFLKAQVRGHTRRKNGRVVYVSPYRTKVPPATPDASSQRDQRQPDLFAQRGKATPAARVPTTETPAFKAWFGDSKVVDEDGKPRVVYHGSLRWDGASRVDGRPVEFGNVTAFDRHFARREVGKNPSLDNIGSWFTVLPGDTKAGANIYTGGEGGVVYPVYLSIKNPLVLRDGMDGQRRAFDALLQRWNVWHAIAQKHMPPEKAEQVAKLRARNKFWGDPDGFQALLAAKGYDGILIEGFRESEVAPAHDVWIAFRPEQVKSATGNRGTFDPAEPDMTKAMRP